MIGFWIVVNAVLAVVLLTTRKGRGREDTSIDAGSNAAMGGRRKTARRS
jgi:hypothetical protein